MTSPGTGGMDASGALSRSADIASSYSSQTSPPASRRPARSSGPSPGATHHEKGRPTESKCATTPRSAVSTSRVASLAPSTTLKVSVSRPESTQVRCSDSRIVAPATPREGDVAWTRKLSVAALAMSRDRVTAWPPPLLLERDLAGLELAQNLAQRVDQLVALHARLLERDVDLERPVLRLEDEGERLRLRLPRALDLLLLAKIVARRSAHDLRERLFHLALVVEARDLEKHGARVDVGAPTFLAQPLRNLEQRHRLGDRDARLSDRRRDLLLRVAVRVGERRVAHRLPEG